MACAHKVLVRSTPYGGYAGDGLGDASEEHISKAIQTLGVTTGWPYDALLLQDGTDFQLVTIDNAVKIHNWNAKYSYPRLICSTMDMFFNDLAAQAKPGTIKTFSSDGNNEWVDEDATDAWALGVARRQDELIPTAEKFSTIATMLAGGGNIPGLTSIRPTIACSTGTSTPMPSISSATTANALSTMKRRMPKTERW